VRSGERRGPEGDRAPVLQAAVPERARLRGGQRRRHHRAGAVVRPAPRARHRQVRRERRGPPGAGRELSQPEEAQPPQLRPGHRPRHTAHRVLLPRAAAAQHTRLSDIPGRVQGREEVLQAVHHRAHQPRVLLNGARPCFGYPIDSYILAPSPYLGLCAAAAVPCSVYNICIILL